MPTEKEWEQHNNTKTGAKCGNCACDITYGNDAGTGFCKDCQEEIDSVEQDKE